VFGLGAGALNANREHDRNGPEFYSNVKPPFQIGALMPLSRNGRSDFSAACALLGYSAAAVSSKFDVRLDTARSWISGRRTAPPDIWAKLAADYSVRDPEFSAEAAIYRAVRRLRAL